MTDVRVYARRLDGSISGEMVMWDELTVVDRWRDLGRWTMVTSDEALISFWLDDRGAGVVIRRGTTTIMSGVADELEVTYQGAGRRMVVSGTCDGWVLRNLAWPDPDLSLGAQTSLVDTRTGTAETMLLGYIEDNLVTRMGMSLTIPSSLARGTSHSYRARFTPLLQVCQELLVLDDEIGFRVVQQSDDSIGVEVWEASDLTDGVGLLSDQTGTVLDWRYTQKWPVSTRAIAGGDETGTNRLLRQVTDSTAESAWERTVETFVDARSVDEDDAVANAQLDAAAQKALNDDQGSDSYEMTVADPIGLDYGVDIRVGDIVRAYPGGVQVDARITEATLTVARGEGETVQLWVGQRAQDELEQLRYDSIVQQRRLAYLERNY